MMIPLLDLFDVDPDRRSPFWKQFATLKELWSEYIACNPIVIVDNDVDDQEPQDSSGRSLKVDPKVVHDQLKMFSKNVSKLPQETLEK